MRIDTPIKIRGVPAARRRHPVRLAMSVASALRASFEENTPTVSEVLFFSILGLVFGYSLQAWSFQAILVACCIVAGAAWGMVLGLLLDRFQQQLARAT